MYDFPYKNIVTTLKNKTLAGAGCVQKDTTVDYCHTYNLRKWVVAPGNVKPASAYPLTCLCTELHLPWRVSSKQLSASCPWVDVGSDFHTSALRGVALAMRLLTRKSHTVTVARTKGIVYEDIVRIQPKQMYLHKKSHATTSHSWRCVAWHNCNLTTTIALLVLRVYCRCSRASYSSRNSSKEIFSVSILRKSSGSSSVRKVRLRSLAIRRTAPLATK